ncbi:MAG: DUF6503 family protein [Bacteroidota bacterium]
MKATLSILLLLTLGLLACSKVGQKAKNADSKNSLIRSAIEAHGGSLYDRASYSFDFRGTTYGFKNRGEQFVYTKNFEKKGQQFSDTLSNKGFVRMVDGVRQPLSEKDAKRYGDALNSVIYFAMLPYKLEDPAVLKTNKGSIRIKGQEYYQVEVRFEEEGGGTDHDDVFYYWLHKNNFTVDYLAYLYHTNGGGVRFRSAYNPRIVDGIRFQDYINYKASADTPLDSLPKMYEAGQLRELSRIELVDIKLQPEDQ